MAGINFKAFDLGGHEIARRVWKDYYAKARASRPSVPVHACETTEHASTEWHGLRVGPVLLAIYRRGTGLEWCRSRPPAAQWRRL